MIVDILTPCFCHSLLICFRPIIVKCINNTGCIVGCQQKIHRIWHHLPKNHIRHHDDSLSKHWKKKKSGYLFISYCLPVNFGQPRSGCCSIVVVGTRVRNMCFLYLFFDSRILEETRGLLLSFFCQKQSFFFPDLPMLFLKYGLAMDPSRCKLRRLRWRSTGQSVCGLLLFSYQTNKNCILVAS